MLSGISPGTVGAFSAAVAAFEAKDADAFRWVLNRVELLPYCELICEWVRVKLGVLRCIELCGVPREKVQVPDLQQFARAVVQLASNERLLRRVVDAVACGDGDDYRAAIAELKLTEFCYLICHWVYLIIYRRVCEVVCSPERIRLTDAVGEVQAASKAVATVLENESAIAAISKAAVNLDCEDHSISDQRGGLSTILRNHMLAHLYVAVCLGVLGTVHNSHPDSYRGGCDRGGAEFCAGDPTVRQQAARS